MLHVRDCKVPWPIVWVLARFSRKHIFSSRKLPPPEWMCSAMQDFGQRIRWKWFFRNSSAPKPSIVFRSTSHCGHVVDPGLVFWLDRFHQQMIGEMLPSLQASKAKEECSIQHVPASTMGPQLTEVIPVEGMLDR